MTDNYYASQKDYEEANGIGEPTTIQEIEVEAMNEKPHWCSRIRNVDTEFNEKFGEKSVLHDQTME